jgi:hypothetical protein
MQLDLSLTCGSVHGQIHRFDKCSPLNLSKKMHVFFLTKIKVSCIPLLKEKKKAQVLGNRIRETYNRDTV